MFFNLKQILFGAAFILLLLLDHFTFLLPRPLITWLLSVRTMAPPAKKPKKGKPKDDAAYGDAKKTGGNDDDAAWLRDFASELTPTKETSGGTTQENKFGISPSKKQFGDKNSPDHLSNCKLRLARIKMAQGRCVLLFRIEGNDKDKPGHYFEKILGDCIFENKAFTKNLFFDKETYKWVEHGEEQLNHGGYPIKLFVIYSDTYPGEEKLVEMAKYLADELNGLNASRSKVFADEDNLFWGTNPVTWSEVIGPKPAYEKLLENIGTPDGSEAFYHKHKDAIHSYFRIGTLPRLLASVLGAPATTLNDYVADDEGDEEKKD